MQYEIPPHMDEILTLQHITMDGTSLNNCHYSVAFTS